MNSERAKKALFEERERIARELHDGIAQSLFLLTVKIMKLEEDNPSSLNENLQGIRETIHRVHDDVRQAISNLRYPPSPNSLPWTQNVQDFIHDFEKETGLSVFLQWKTDEKQLSLREKVEILACLREALMQLFMQPVRLPVYGNLKIRHTAH
ncbi:sensor histidine kinase [Effusibacillus consociatus]|uniref:histidine kinase n=1 Tax=Effusibacillus consociatus TaxID=1117041 RepID=A0ABV9Q5W2_9BACL